MGKGTVTVAVYNSLATARAEYIRLPIAAKQTPTIKDSTGAVVPSDITPSPTVANTDILTFQVRGGGDHLWGETERKKKKEPC